MSKERDRVVCVSLSEAEWKALTERHPEPVDWLRGQILSEIGTGQPLPGPQPAVGKGHSIFSTRRV
ncbi:MAG: hypothetical protein U0Q55_06795 [Vicinamibacterales bacterium]